MMVPSLSVRFALEERWLRVKSPGVEEDDLVPRHAIDVEDVLDRSQEGEGLDGCSQFLLHFANDRVSVRLAEVDASADQAVVALRVLSSTGIDRDRMGGNVVVRRYEHRFHPDERSIYRHGLRLVTAQSAA
jgi:hypothetical protein